MTTADIELKGPLPFPLLVHIPSAKAQIMFKRTDFKNIYRQLVDSWQLYDNSGERAVLIEEG